MSTTPHFELVRDGDGSSFRLHGELDLAAAAELLESLQPLLRRGTEIRLQLSELGFIDSSGLRALVKTAAALLPDGKLVLEGPTGPVASLFELVRADLLPGFEIVDRGPDRATRNPRFTPVDGRRGDARSATSAI
jgi:anti-anti-sigma factor